jgi:hypothetical protein
MLRKIACLLTGRIWYDPADRLWFAALVRTWSPVLGHHGACPGNRI